MSSTVLPLGVSKNEKSYRFAVWAPHAKQVSLIGEFNNWNDSADLMQRKDNDIWSISKTNLNNSDQYKFCITTEDGSVLYKNDPRARLLTNSDGNSVIYDDIFNWNIDTFDPPPIHEQIIYELHIGTFNRIGDEVGTFHSAIEKLPDLVELGINIIEIMPINEFAGNLSWGYNPAYPFAVEEAYGGPDGLKSLIDAAHGLGIGVIIDVVYNHFGPSDLDLWQFDGWSENNKGGIYFYNDDRSNTPWGDTRPDYGRPEVREYIKDNALMWLNEYKADGLRMDMIPYMRSVSGIDTGDDDIPEAYELLQVINTHIAQMSPAKISIAEDLHNHHFITDAVEHGGCGYSAQWDAIFVHPVRDNLTKTDDSHVNLDEIETALLHVYSNNAYSRVLYTESHDEVANGQARVVEEVAPGNVDDDFFAEQKSMLGVAIVMTSAGRPMLFQGQEMKEPGWFTDEKALDWARKDRFESYFNGVKKLVNLRKNANGQTGGLCGEATDILHKDYDNKIIGYRRYNKEHGQDVFVCLNFSHSTIDNYSIQGFPNNIKLVFCWYEGAEQSITITNGIVDIKPYSIMIFNCLDTREK